MSSGTTAEGRQSGLYVVTYYCCDHEDYQGTFSTLEKAQAYVMEQAKQRGFSPRHVLTDKGDGTWALHEFTIEPVEIA